MGDEMFDKLEKERYSGSRREDGALLLVLEAGSRENAQKLIDLAVSLLKLREIGGVGSQ